MTEARDTARQFSLLEYFPQVQELLAQRPDEGWATLGGPVLHLAELILAYLEHHAIAFNLFSSVESLEIG